MLLADSNGNKYPLFFVIKQQKSTVKATVRDNMQLRRGFGLRVWNSEMRLLSEGHNGEIHGNSTAWWNSRPRMYFEPWRRFS